jgi:transcriptional regulator with XRE-family HTH domain
MTPEGLSLPQRIRWARKRAGLSQERFAEQLGTSRRHVIRWENREQPTRPGSTYVARMAEITGQPQELFQDEDDEESDPVDLLYRAVCLIVAQERERV